MVESISKPIQSYFIEHSNPLLSKIYEWPNLRVRVFTVTNIEEDIGQINLDALGNSESGKLPDHLLVTKLPKKQEKKRIKYLSLQ